MKHLLHFFLLVSIAIGQSSPPAQPSAPVEQESSRKARMLIDQMIQALGGPAYLGIQDASQEGRAYSFHHGEPNSLGVLFWRFYKFPDRERIELTKKRDVAYVYNGDKGYE